jgi:hypothetical protein
MKIKLLKPYQLLEKGMVIDCIDTIAVELLKRRAAKAVTGTESVKKDKKFKRIKNENT